LSRNVSNGPVLPGADDDNEDDDEQGGTKGDGRQVEMEVEAAEGTVDQTVMYLGMAICFNAAFNTEVGEMETK
jgi:hypothetical protein